MLPRTRREITAICGSARTITGKIMFAIAPLFLVWFGVGATPKILVAFLISFFPIVIDAAVGLRSMSSEMMDLARSMGVDPRGGLP